MFWNNFQIKSRLQIIFGTFLVAVGINVFLIPAKLSSGGISSIGTVLFYIFGIPLSFSNLFFNAILLFVGFKSLGKESLKKTILGILLLSLFLEVTKIFPMFSGDALSASLSGGVLMGLGLGLVIRVGASTGGSDFLGLMLNKTFPHISVATFILVIDFIIITVSGIVFKSMSVAVYSFLALFFTAKVADFLLSFGDIAKTVFIISEDYAMISDEIMRRLGRGVTGVYSKGMYTKNDAMMIICVVSPKELPGLVALVKRMDEKAFIIINDAREVLGEGFKS